MYLVLNCNHKQIKLIHQYVINYLTIPSCICETAMKLRDPDATLLYSECIDRPVLIINRWMLLWNFTPFPEIIFIVYADNFNWHNSVRSHLTVSGVFTFFIFRFSYFVFLLSQVWRSEDLPQIDVLGSYPRNSNSSQWVNALVVFWEIMFCGRRRH